MLILRERAYPLRYSPYCGRLIWGGAHFPIGDKLQVVHMTRINGAGQHRAERQCAAMIKIRYRNANELPPGLHATAERHGRTVTIYLLPGLAAEERNAALRRLRLSGRMGHGPRLPGVQLR